MTSRQQKCFDKINKKCIENGVNLKSTEFISSKEHMLFACPNCGKIRKILPQHILNESFNFLCPECSRKQQKIEILNNIAKLMEEKGAKLLSTTYVNSNENLKFKCSRCGDIGFISDHMIKMGSNKNFLCHSCQPN